MRSKPYTPLASCKYFPTKSVFQHDCVGKASRSVVKTIKQGMYVQHFGVLRHVRHYRYLLPVTFAKKYIYFCFILVFLQHHSKIKWNIKIWFLWRLLLFLIYFLLNLLFFVSWLSVFLVFSLFIEKSKLESHLSNLIELLDSMILARNTPYQLCHHETF